MTHNPNDVNIIYQPISGTSQAFALDSRADHTLYDGTRGVGKTSVQLMRFRSRVGIGYGQYWRGVIFDVEFDHLAGLVAESKKLFNAFEDGAQFLSSASLYKWVWPTGEELLFRHVKKPSDYDGFHGHEYPFIGWNELTKWATSYLYDKLMSCNRSSFQPEKHTPSKIVNKENKNGYLCEDGKNRIFETNSGKPLPDIPLEVFSTTNPSGPGHNWVKSRFVTVGRPGQRIFNKSIVFDPKLKEDVEVVKSQVRIFGSYKENEFLPTSYIAELDKITDPNLRKAWFKGDWDVVSGGAFDDVWSTNVHIVPRFAIPKGWKIDRGFDWGSTHPFAVCWFAEANGEEAELEDGTKWCPAAGSIIQIFEWYGTEKIGTNKGLKLGVKSICDGIKEREIGLMEGGWIAEQPSPGPADNAIESNERDDQTTIADDMRKEGIKWTSSDKKPGSRKNGMQKFRDMLQASLDKEGAGFYVMDCCQATIHTVPWLPRSEKQPDDVNTDAEDHIYDVLRYKVTDAKKQMASGLKLEF